MLIETLNKQLKEKYPQGEAWVNNKNQVCVVFDKNSKVYTYKLTILKTAEKLKLIPEINVWEESKNLAKAIKSAGFGVGHIECNDTISHILEDSISISNPQKDEFDRKIVTFQIDTTPNLWT